MTYAPKRCKNRRRKST